MPEMTPLELAKGLELTAMWRAKCPDKGDGKLFREAASYLRKIASGEYAPVVHARWVNMPFNVDNDKYGMNKYNKRIKCTNCGFVTSSDLTYAHCPVCGALTGKDDSHEIN